MSLNSVGRPTRPVSDAPGAGFASLSGGRGLLQDEALIFERSSWTGTGVDLPEPEAGSEDLGGLVRAEPLRLPGLSDVLGRDVGRQGPPGTSKSAIERGSVECGICHD